MTPVVIAFTPNYFIPAATLISSVIRSSAGDFVFICLVTEEIPDRQKSLLQGLTGERATFRYLKVEELDKDVYIDPRYSAAAEFRLLLPELLPEYDKVIYVDCDVIVRNDLAKLYSEIELDEKLLGVVYEAPIGGQAERWEALGCDSGRYFNSGFLIMNLEQMRKEKTSAKLMEALKTDYLEFPDQDALNIVCQGKVLPLPPYWNSIRTFWLPQYKEDFFKQYSKEDLQEVLLHGTIHYTGGKPWNMFTIQFDKWWEVYYSLPASIKKEWQPSKKLYLLSKFYNTTIGFWCVKTLQAVYRKLKR